MITFALPMIFGNLLQQCYNLADTLIVGQFLGKETLAAVGSSFTLMTFLTSILLGLCMGSGALFSIRFGQGDEGGLEESLRASFLLIAMASLVLNVLTFVFLDAIEGFLQVPPEVWGMMRDYLAVIYLGITATFLYNFFTSFLRAIGNSVVPLVFLAISSVLNIVLDFWFVLGLGRGVAGAAEATVIAQFVSGIGIGAYAWICPPGPPALPVRPHLPRCHPGGRRLRRRGQDRCLYLYARPGLRQRLLHLHRPKLWGKKRRPNPPRPEGGRCPRWHPLPSNREHILRLHRPGQTPGPPHGA